MGLGVECGVRIIRTVYVLSKEWLSAFTIYNVSCWNTAKGVNLVSLDCTTCECARVLAGQLSDVCD